MGTGSKTLSRWYWEMAQQIAAGFTLPRSLAGAGGPPREDRERMSRALLEGRSWEEVLRTAPRWLPPPDRPLLAAFARSGRLAEGMRLLSEKHAVRAGQIRRAWTASLYPLFVLHFAILVMPLLQGLPESVSGYLSSLGAFYFPLWAVLGLLIWAAVRRHAWLDRLTGLLPWLRGYRNHRALADLAFSLEAFLLSGETVDAAWEAAGLAAGRKALAKAAKRMADAARRGSPPGALLGRERPFPSEFVSLYQIGEESGQLDRNLGHLAVMHRERADACLQAASMWYPKILFALIALWVGYLVVSFYAGYFRQIEGMLL